MVLCLPLIASQVVAKSSPIALPEAQIAKLADKARAYLDLAYRLNAFPQPSPAYRRLDERPIYEPYQAQATGGELLEFRTTGNTVCLRRSDGSLAWLSAEPAFLPLLNGRIKEGEARQFAIDYYYALGGRGEPVLESSTPSKPDRYAPSRYTEFVGMSPYCYDLVHYANGLRVLGGGWHMEIDPIAGRLVEISTSLPPPQVEGPLSKLITPQQAATAVADAIRRVPEAPNRFRVVCGGGVKPTIEPLRFSSGWRTELTLNHKRNIERRIAIPVYRPQVQQLPGTVYKGRVWPILWDAVVDARSGKCLAISARIDLLNEVLTPGDRPQEEKADPAFPIMVKGVLMGKEMTPAPGQIKAAPGNVGSTGRNVTLSTAEGYRMVFFDLKTGFVRSEGVIGRPNASLLGALKASVAAPTKPFGKG